MEIGMNVMYVDYEAIEYHSVVLELTSPLYYDAFFCLPSQGQQVKPSQCMAQLSW